MNKKEDLPAFEIGYYGRPCFGERVSGDWAFHDQINDWLFLAIVDGLGHGKNAHEIALKTKDFLSTSWTPNVTRTLSQLHETLKGTGGAAVGLASINLNNRILHYVGVGNTVFRKIGSAPNRLLSREGVAGVRNPIQNEQKISIELSDIILMYTDGVSERFGFEEIPQISNQSPGLGAKTIVRKFGNQYDDATCLVIKVKNEI